MDIIENMQTEVMNMDLSQRLQELRKKEGYSQEQVAEMLGLSRQAISKWESGQGKPEIDNIIKLTEIYHVSADYILSGTDCVYVNNRNWDDMTFEEQEEVRQNFEEERKELEEDFPVDGAEGKFTSYILDKVEEGMKEQR